MVILHSLEALHEWQNLVHWKDRKTSFVPTMGALHEGHLSLITKALEQAELVVVSVLVNPTQFNDPSDYDGYPRTLESDAAKAASAGAHAVFAPTAEGLYGGVPTAPEVRWGALTDAYEGAFRAGHFDGVIRVVDLLFQAVRPNSAVFGAKDLQQVAVVRRMAQERHPQVAIVVGELVRDARGLALSSRNVRLDDQGMEQALALHEALSSIHAAGQALDADGCWTEALEHARKQLEEQVGLEYLDVVDGDTFEPQRKKGKGAAYAVVAAHVQGVRLIDNMRVA